MSLNFVYTYIQTIQLQVKTVFHQVLQSELCESFLKRFQFIKTDVTNLTLCIVFCTITARALLYFYDRMFTLYGFVETAFIKRPTKEKQECSNCESVSSKRFYIVNPCLHMICHECVSECCKFLPCNCPNCPNRVHGFCTLCSKRSVRDRVTENNWQNMTHQFLHSELSKCFF